MRSSLIHVTALAALACSASAAFAQGAPKPDRGNAESTAPRDEEAAGRVDPAVLDRCRQQAAEQRLKDGPERKAFMGTCVSPED